MRLEHSGGSMPGRLRPPWDTRKRALGFWTMFLVVEYWRGPVGF